MIDEQKIDLVSVTNCVDDLRSTCLLGKYNYYYDFGTFSPSVKYII